MEVAIYALPEDDFGELTLVAVSELVVDGDGPHSVAIGPQGALVTSWTGRVFYSHDGDRWTSVEGLPSSDGKEAAATSEGFYLGRGHTFYSTNGVEWAQIGELSSSIGRLRAWGDDALSHDESTIWRITPAGIEQIYESPVPFDMFGPGDVAGSELGVLAVGLDTGGNTPGIPDGRGYVYSPDGVDWEQGILPDGWAVINVFVEEAIAINDQTILVIASGTESERGGVLDGNLVLIATR